jgi:hypothetical protein
MPDFKFLCLWLFNSVEVTKLSEFLDYKNKIDTCQFVCSRTKDVLEYSKAQYESSVEAFKSVFDRSDKLLGIALLLSGWIFTSAKNNPNAGNRLWVLAIVSMTLATLVLLFGRVRMRRSVPVDFEPLAIAAIKLETNDSEWEFYRAKQYNLAMWGNQKQTQYEQARLFIAVLFLSVGLLLLAFRAF